MGFGLTSNRAPPLAFAVVSLGIGLMGMTAGWFEAAPIFASGFDEKDAFRALSAGEVVPGPSTQSRNLVLNDCLTALNSFYGLAQPSEERRRVTEQCREIAGDIAKQTPSMSLAWLVQATTGAERQDWASFNLDLQRSRFTAPNEEWLAALRVDLAERHLADLDAKSQADHRDDLRLMAQSTAGAAALAERYVAFPDFRDRVTPLIGDLSPNVQRAFLAAVTEAHKRQGGR